MYRVKYMQFRNFIFYVNSIKYILVAPDLTPPTYETFEQQVYKAFGKVEKLLVNEEASLRISVSKEGEEFIVKAEFWNSENLMSKEKNRDLRVAVDIVAREIRDQLVKAKDKKGPRKMTEKIKNLRNKLLSRNIE